MKVLNLYAGIGGNRKLWPEECEVTAVENNLEIAEIYSDFFPQDKMIPMDAHKFLLKHYKEFDFIWSSPPCPTHSRTNTFLNAQGIIRYPDMNLYQEIILLKQWFKGKWVVENVISYYKPLIKPQLADRHYFWSNFRILQLNSDINFNVTNSRESTRRPSKDYYDELEKYHGFNLSSYKIKDKLVILRNCLNTNLCLNIFNCAFKVK